MPSSPIVVNEQLRAAVTPAAALRLARAVVEDEGGEVVEAGPTTLVATSGSRAAHRVFGHHGPGAGRLPVRLRFTVSPARGGAVVDLRMTSDEGWYVVRVPAVEDAYCVRFRRILGALEGVGLTRARAGSRARAAARATGGRAGR